MPLQEWSLVAIPDKGEAIRAIKARHPHAAIRVNSEANAELLAKYRSLETAKFLCSWKAHDPRETSPRSLSWTMNSSSASMAAGNGSVGEHERSSGLQGVENNCGYLLFRCVHYWGQRCEKGVSLLH